MFGKIVSYGVPAALLSLFAWSHFYAGPEWAHNVAVFLAWFMVFTGIVGRLFVIGALYFLEAGDADKWRKSMQDVHRKAPYSPVKVFVGRVVNWSFVVMAVAAGYVALPIFTIGSMAVAWLMRCFVEEHIRRSGVAA